MDASYLSFLLTNDFRCVFRYYYGVNANTGFMIHEILKYENIFILMEKMGKQYSQTPLKSQTMFRKYCVGVGEEGDLG